MASTTRADSNKERVLKFNEAVGSGDLGGLDAVFSDDVTDHTPLGTTHGIEAVREIHGYLLSAFSDYSLTVDEAIADGDVVAIRATERGTHTGEFMDVEPTGNDFEFGKMEFCRIEDGEIVERWVQPDLFGLLTQLGAIEPPT